MCGIMSSSTDGWHERKRGIGMNMKQTVDGYTYKGILIRKGYYVGETYWSVDGEIFTRFKDAKAFIDKKKEEENK